MTAKRVPMIVKDEKLNVLVVSHNPFSDTQSNGKTLSAFFKKWNNARIAQLYLTTDVPDFTVCDNFFQINDFDILKRFIFQKDIQGRRVKSVDITDTISYNRKINKNLVLKLIRNSNSSFFRFCRDMLWIVSGYKTKKLIEFLDEFNPQVVFFQSSSGVFAFSVVKWICQSRNIPLVMQTTDDYVTGKFTLNPFFWIQHLRVTYAYKYAVSYANCVVAIGDKMAKEYQKRFGGNYIVAMNSITTPNIAPYIVNNPSVQLVYAGNLGLNRWKVLALIAECLQELKLECGLNAEMTIYSLLEPDKPVLHALTNPPYSFYKGSVNSDELDKIKGKSDLLIHVEAFDAINRHVTRLSISTKIPEYLVSGRCIFAVGPSDVASIQYLIENDLGMVVTTNNKQAIKKGLREIIVDNDKRLKYGIKGVQIAADRHNPDKTAELINQLITTAVRRHGIQI